MRKTAENIASNENFAAIREQLRATTRDTEDIKQLLSQKAWLNQQQWVAREKYYAALLADLQIFRQTMLELTGYYMEPGSEHTKDSEQGEYFNTLLTRTNESHRRIQQMAGPAAIYLSKPSSESLQQFSIKYWNSANFSACTAEYVDRGYNMVAALYDVVLAEANKHLHVE